MGPGRGSHTEPFGSYFYTDSWVEAESRRACTQGAQHVRFAVFAGQESCILARPGDPTDSSRVSKHLALSRPVIRAALKARDADAKWVSQGDSVRRGRLAVIVSGDKKVLAPRFAVRTSAQLFPLGLVRPSNSNSC